MIALVTLTAGVLTPDSTVTVDGATAQVPARDLTHGSDFPQARIMDAIRTLGWTPDRFLGTWKQAKSGNFATFAVKVAQ